MASAQLGEQLPSKTFKLVLSSRKSLVERQFWLTAILLHLWGFYDPLCHLRAFQVFGICFVACAWLLNIVMTLYSVKNKTLLRPKSKRIEDFYSYHGLHQGEVFEDGNAANIQRIQARRQDIENGETPAKRYMQEFSNGA